ncbi:MAG: DUF2336 domain-containing protein [Kiloniellales bacterium]|nr:DUF2336 domain-containing protein [Kiloniellales bacterium]
MASEKRLQGAQSLIDEALKRSLAARRGLLDSVRGYLEGGSSTLTDREKTLYDGILSHLIGEIEGVLRLRLAESLSGRPGVPGDLVMALSDSSVEIAKPLLLGRALLSDEALIEIVYYRLMAHQVAAAQPCFGGYGEDGGREDPLRDLLHRAEPEVSEAAKAYLIHEAGRLDSFQDPVLCRDELDPALDARLAWHIAAALRHHVLTGFEADAAQIDQDLEAAVLELTGRERAGASAATNGPAGALADELLTRSQINPDTMAAILRRGEAPLFEALFSRLLGINARRVRFILYAPDDSDFAIACRALDLAAAEFVVLRGLLWRGRPGAPEDPESGSRAFERYEAIDPEAARDVLAFWQRHGCYLDAIQNVESAAPPQP